VAVLPFLLGAVMSLLNLVGAGRSGMATWFSGGWILALLIATVVGLIKELPRWSLPYFGVIGLDLSWVLTHRGTYMGMNTRAGLLGPVLGWVDHLVRAALGPSTPWTMRVICGTGLDWIALLGITACALLIIAAFRPLRPLFRRIRCDWTLLSFALYGASATAVFLTFEDYPPSKYPFTFLSSVILAVGAWAYLRFDGLGARRAWTLVAALIMVAAVGAAGKGVLYASPDWPYPHSFTWQSEALHGLLLWGWVMLAILAPAALSLLPRPEVSPGAAGE
jgi:hypothetical protein